VEILVTPDPTSTYAPRDVINAPAIKASIERRSKHRADTPAVQAWLLSHFYRQVIGNLSLGEPHLQRVETSALAEKLCAPETPPQWTHTRLKQASSTAPLWWIDPQAPELLATETKLVEFLNSRQGTPLEGKLMRINAPQALAQWAAEHAAIEAQVASGRRTHQPGALKIAWQGELGAFMEFIPTAPELRAELAFESQTMRHCVGQFATRRSLEGGYGEHYASQCEQGKLRLFTYRIGPQHPHITISASVTPDGRVAVDQIKGKQNRPPIERYRSEVLGFLNSLPTTTDTPNDAMHMGLARVSSGWYIISDITHPSDQLQLVQRQPDLIRQLPNPSKLVQWLVAASNPQSLKGLDLTPSVAQALEPQP
jgi:hypothetical protein